MPALAELIARSILEMRCEPTRGCSWWIYVALKGKKLEEALDITHRVLEKIGLRKADVPVDVAELCSCGLRARHAVAKYCSDKYSEPLVYICSPGLATVLSTELRRRHILVVDGVNLKVSNNLYRDLPGVEASLVVMRRKEELYTALKELSHVDKPVNYILVVNRTGHEKITLPYTRPHVYTPGQETFIAYAIYEGESTLTPDIVKLDQLKK